MPIHRRATIAGSCAIACVALAGSARASDPTFDPASLVVPTSTVISTSAFAVAAAADWATTAHFLIGHGGHEDNPVINWAPNAPATIAVGAALDVAGAIAWRRLTRGHPRWTATGFYAAAALRVAFAARNEYRIAHAPGATAPCAVNCVAVFDHR
jgi:hypothetical protein